MPTAQCRGVLKLSIPICRYAAKAGTHQNFPLHGAESPYFLLVRGVSSYFTASSYIRSAGQAIVENISRWRESDSERVESLEI